MLIRVKADAIGLMSEDFLHDRVVDNDDIYSGYTDVYIRPDQMNSFFEHHDLPLPRNQH
jgi:PhoH-like ATPase